MPISSESIVGSLTASIDSAKPSEKPYKNWFLTKCLPAEAAANVIELPFEPPSLEGISGKRELHNNTRKYFDAENMARFPVCKAFNDAFQDKRITGLIERHFGTNLAGSYLRVEFAPGYRRLLAGAAHRPWGQTLHDVALHVDRPAPRRSRHRHL